MFFRKLIVELKKEFQIYEERHYPRTEMRHVVSQKRRSRLNFPPSFFSRGLLNRQSANLMEYPGDLYYVLVLYTESTRWRCESRLARCQREFQRVQPLRPYPPSFCLFALHCRFFRGALDIENKLDTIHVVLSRYYNFK